MYTTLILGKNATQTGQSKCDEMLFSDIYLCADYVSNIEEKYRILHGKEFQRDVPAKDILVLTTSQALALACRGYSWSLV